MKGHAEIVSNVIVNWRTNPWNSCKVFHTVYGSSLFTKDDIEILGELADGRPDISWTVVWRQFERSLKWNKSVWEKVGETEKLSQIAFRVIGNSVMLEIMPVSVR